MIAHDPAARLRLLRTPGTSYAFRLDADDVPRHVRWGRPLSREQAVAVAGDLPAEDPGGDDPGGEEFAVEGSLRFGAPWPEQPHRRRDVDPLPLPRLDGRRPWLRRRP